MKCYDVKDLQEILGVGRASVYELLKRKEFRWVLVGGKYRISKRSFDSWLNGSGDTGENASVSAPLPAAQLAFAGNVAE